MNAPTRGLLADVLSTWQSHGWDPTTLASFRMEAASGAEGAEGGGQGGEGGEGGQGDGFKPITSQDDLNRVIADRVSRERAKYSDYGALKTKAAELDQLKQAGKSEADQIREELAAVREENAKLARSTLQARIQAKHGISDEDAELFLTGADEESLTKQAQRLAARDADRKKQGNHVSHEGRNPRTAASDERAATRALFGSG